MLSEKESRLSYDRAMINCIREDGGTHTFFKSKPPVRGFTLFFKDPQVMMMMMMMMTITMGTTCYLLWRGRHVNKFCFLLIY